MEVFGATERIPQVFASCLVGCISQQNFRTVLGILDMGKAVVAGCWNDFVHSFSIGLLNKSLDSTSISTGSLSGSFFLVSFGSIRSLPCQRIGPSCKLVQVARAEPGMVSRAVAYRSGADRSGVDMGPLGFWGASPSQHFLFSCRGFGLGFSERATEEHVKRRKQVSQCGFNGEGCPTLRGYFKGALLCDLAGLSLFQGRFQLVT